MTGAQAHPNNLGALSALADLADQHRWLADLIEPGRRRHRTQPIGPATRATLTRQHRAERADLTATLRAGLAPTGVGRTPADLGALQAQICAQDVAVEAAWRCSSALRLHPMLAWTTVADRQPLFDAAVGYLRVALRVVPPDLAGTVGVELNDAARRAGAVTGAGPDRADLHASCPACGRRTLQAHTTSMFADALVTCVRPDCRCRGFDCLCQRPARVPGLRHMWPSTEFDQLARRLGAAA